MSGRISQDFKDEREALAAEYALGVLDTPARDAARSRLLRDPEFARNAQDWQMRLAPIADGIEPITPPDTLWPRIAASLDDVTRAPVAPVAVRSSGGFWRAATLATGLLAAGVAAFAFIRTPPPPVEAVLASSGATGFVASVQPDGAILVRAIGTPSVPAGRDLELWALPQGAVRPVSLGVLPGTGRQGPRAPSSAPGTQLLVSLEPAGGSPTRQPTGPVVFAGTLQRL